VAEIPEGRFFARQQRFAVAADAPAAPGGHGMGDMY